MRKLIFAMAFFGLITSSFATWFNPVTVGSIRVLPGGRVFFQTSGFESNPNRWWTFDGTTAGGKNMFTILLTVKTSKLTFQMDGGTTRYSNTDAPSNDTYNINGLQYN